ncbi:NAD(P)-dependent oxidoreductase [Rhodovarius lipocyclicus]|uniref:NAD(P)-dependent oxidoreductase n=1 Tax=Rhodovarius lipocyclicus TaxID=268410 RepID=UPI001358AB20|nr:NAD(P)-dependent oxidoreductase [Rhodovarius lipocyclicus]
MTTPVIGFVGFGEAAQCFAAHLATQGQPPMPVYCDGPTNHPPYSDAFRAKAASLGAEPMDSLRALMARADIVFSAVVVATAAQVGQAIAALARPGMLVVDINASTPRAKLAVAQAVTARGAAFVDANLMGAVSLYGARVPLYASGDGMARFLRVFTPLGFTIEDAGPLPGTAAAVKLLRSVVTKGIEALVMEALTAATLAGVRPEALRGICEPMDATSFSGFLDMCVRTDVLHAERRAVEMEGVADGLREMGVEPLMTTATAARLRASAALGLRGEFAARKGYDAAQVLDAYAAAMRG